MISDTKECPYCAETIKAQAIVCRYCGKDLSSETLLPTPQKSKKLESSKKDFKKIMFMVGVAIVLLLVFWFGAEFTQSKIEWPGGDVYCFGSELYFNKYQQALKENDVTIFSYITDDPDTISLNNDTKVKVLVKGSGMGAAKVQVLDGYYKDRTCWTYQMAIK